ncbi:MAG: CCA tRNA nucleotidyltransferase [Candidatus Thermoplasmatota archaeon]|nr:CCA tRNA nucleotidyltransferase [Candidatus Thermoplasmatota archaeon]
MIDLNLLKEEDRLVISRINEKGRAWIVGGWVRDSLSGLIPTELDLATTLTPRDVQAIFPRSIMTGEKFGTTIVRIDDSEKASYQCEVTTLRADGGYGDGRRPDNVVFGQEIEADLARRDFTINAMAVDGSGRLIDPFGGLDDLQEGLLRTVGSAEERISEDGLRILRAFRFMGTEGGDIRKMDVSLITAISSNLRMLESVSKERIWAELGKILSGKNALEIVESMKESGVLEVILGGIEANTDVVFSGDKLVNLALIYSNEQLNPSELSTILTKNLRLSNKEAGTVSFLHGLREIEIDHSLGSIRRFCAVNDTNVRIEILDYLSGIGKDLSKFQESLVSISSIGFEKRCLIDGNSLSEITGLKPGRRLGRLKDWLHTIQIQRGITNREEVISSLEEIDWRESDYERWPVLSWP